MTASAYTHKISELLNMYDQEWKTCEKILDEVHDCLDMTLDGGSIFSAMEKSGCLSMQLDLLQAIRDSFKRPGSDVVATKSSDLEARKELLGKFSDPTSTPALAFLSAIPACPFSCTSIIPAVPALPALPILPSPLNVSPPPVAFTFTPPAVIDPILPTVAISLPVASIPASVHTPASSASSTIPLPSIVISALSTAASTSPISGPVPALPTMPTATPVIVSPATTVSTPISMPAPAISIVAVHTLPAAAPSHVASPASVISSPVLVLPSGEDYEVEVKVQGQDNQYAGARSGTSGMQGGFGNTESSLFLFYWLTF
ncbi:hypothetical protein F5148DRAFT_1285488 [Russula earlei]|uniref:Uncharacterized protein n=1 Tax=Russula earlei TaxID=71964 RepID=A0ACC0U6U5_9AGAM|nr:hypothetical protein F5148DRAFT_1285488 [Russula earlei]